VKNDTYVHISEELPGMCHESNPRVAICCRVYFV